MSTVLLDTTDLGEAEVALSAAYSTMRVEGRPTTRTRLTRQELSPELGIDDLEIGVDISFTAAPPDMVFIVTVSPNTLRRITDGHDEIFGPGDQYLLSRPGSPYSGLNLSAHTRATRLDPALLARVAAPATTDGRPVRLLDTRPVSPAAATQLQRSIDHLRETIIAQPDAIRAALLMSTASQYIAARVLYAYPSTAELDPTIEDRRDSTPALLRRAIAFIEDNAHRDISLVDIAQSIYMTPRALQYTFRKHRDCTPMEYLRRVRLHHVHLDLVAGNQGTTTVGQIARHWGFAHLGRFATYYRNEYGESPRQTLRR